MQAEFWKIHPENNFNKKTKNVHTQKVAQDNIFVASNFKESSWEPEADTVYLLVVPNVGWGSEVF